MGAGQVAVCREFIRHTRPVCRSSLRSACPARRPRRDVGSHHCSGRLAGKSPCRPRHCRARRRRHTAPLHHIARFHRARSAASNIGCLLRTGTTPRMPNHPRHSWFQWDRLREQKRRTRRYRDHTVHQARSAHRQIRGGGRTQLRLLKPLQNCHHTPGACGRDTCAPGLHPRLGSSQNNRPGHPLQSWCFGRQSARTLAHERSPHTRSDLPNNPARRCWHPPRRRATRQSLSSSKDRRHSHRRIGSRAPPASPGALAARIRSATAPKRIAPALGSFRLSTRTSPHVSHRACIRKPDLQNCRPLRKQAARTGPVVVHSEARADACSRPTTLAGSPPSGPTARKRGRVFPG